LSSNTISPKSALPNQIEFQVSTDEPNEETLGYLGIISLSTSLANVTVSIAPALPMLIVPSMLRFPVRSRLPAILLVCSVCGATADLTQI